VAVNIKTAILWDMTPCILSEVYGSFRRSVYPRNFTPNVRERGPIVTNSSASYLMRQQKSFLNTFINPLRSVVGRYYTSTQNSRSYLTENNTRTDLCMLFVDVITILNPYTRFVGKMQILLI
jgi:hypothetical protein